MNRIYFPVILVHGWNSHPGVWKHLAFHLEAEQISYCRFDYSSMKCASLPDIAKSLQNFIQKCRDEHGWIGQVDIVAHSLGTCIIRYLLEVMDRNDRKEEVRQLIGIGPPNNGSALAELFNHPEMSSAIIQCLSDVFIPDMFDPAVDQMIQDVRPDSRIMMELSSAGLRSDIRYRIILSSNPEAAPEFFPWFEGKTWMIGEDGSFQVTFEGDGVIAYQEALLPGVSIDLLSPSPGGDEGFPLPDQFCHLYMPRNPVVIRMIMRYLLDNPD